jgi:hypothetical protein
MDQSRDRHRLGRIVAATVAFAVGELVMVVLPDPARAARWGAVPGRVLLLMAATFVLTAPPIFGLIYLGLTRADPWRGPGQ